jgi:hypothetical protein
MIMPSYAVFRPHGMCTLSKYPGKPPVTRYFSRVKISENAGSERIKQLLVYSSRSIQNLAAVLDRLMYQYGALVSSKPRKNWLHNHSDLQTPVLIAYGAD